MNEQHTLFKKNYQLKRNKTFYAFQYQVKKKKTLTIMDSQQGGPWSTLSHHEVFKEGLSCAHWSVNYTSFKTTPQAHRDFQLLSLPNKEIQKGTSTITAATMVTYPSFPSSCFWCPPSSSTVVHRVMRVLGSLKKNILSFHNKIQQSRN